MTTATVSRLSRSRAAGNKRPLREIMINAPDQIFVKRHTGPSGYHDA